jgi:hypothetical protein
MWRCGWRPWCGVVGAEPGIDLELATTLLELVIEVEMLEVAGQLVVQPLHSHNLGSHLHGNLLEDIHHLRSQDGFHLVLLLQRPTCEGEHDDDRGDAAQVRSRISDCGTLAWIGRGRGGVDRD